MGWSTRCSPIKIRANVLLVCLLVTIHVPHASPADLSSELSGLLQAEGLSQIAHNNSIGIWIGLRTLNDTAAVALGTRDAAAGTSARVDDIVPAGSLAKSFTAAAVLRLVESGRVSLEDRIAAHLDPYLTRVNHTTLASLCLEDNRLDAADEATLREAWAASNRAQTMLSVDARSGPGSGGGAGGGGDADGDGDDCRLM